MSPTRTVRIIRKGAGVHLQQGVLRRSAMCRGGSGWQRALRNATGTPLFNFLLHFPRPFYVAQGCCETLRGVWEREGEGKGLVAVGAGVGKYATFSPYCTVKPEPRKLILSEAIFVIMISIKA